MQCSLRRRVGHLPRPFLRGSVLPLKDVRRAHKFHLWNSCGAQGSKVSLTQRSEATTPNGKRQNFRNEEVAEVEDGTVSLEALK